MRGTFFVWALVCLVVPLSSTYAAVTGAEAEVFTHKVFRSQMQIYIGVNGMYILCIAFAFVYPRICGILFALIAAFLMIRSVIFMGIGKCRISPVSGND